MRSKRDTTPEALLRLVIIEVEREPTTVDRARTMVRTLLRDGPFPGSLEAVDAASDEEFRDLWGELRVFLGSIVDRSVVNAGGYARPTPIPIRKGIQFSVQARRDGATIAAAATVEDLVVLNVVWLLRDVGLPRVQRCGAADCRRLFVKVGRRKFCSARCQQRTKKREIRARERDADDQQARRRRRVSRGGR
jgi:hypothetical protein